VMGLEAEPVTTVDWQGMLAVPVRRSLSAAGCLARLLRQDLRITAGYLGCLGKIHEWFLYTVASMEDHTGSTIACQDTTTC